MSQITSPIILDSTGKDIVDAIESLSNRANDTENFTSSDVTDGSATEWTSVTPLASGEVHSSIFAKISQMFKNIRYLYKMLGTTNISSIGGGTVTGAISTLNSNKWSLTGGTTIPSNADISSSTYFVPGNYGTQSSADARTMDGLPYPKGSTSNFAFNLKVENAALSDPNARRQILQYYNDVNKYVRYGTANNSTWTIGWIREPTRAEVEALNSKTYLSNGTTVRDSSIASAYTSLPDGSYTCVYAINASDRPLSSNGTVAIFKADNSFGGMYYLPSNGRVYYRALANGTWGEWTMFAIDA